MIAKQYQDIARYAAFIKVSQVRRNFSSGQGTVPLQDALITGTDLLANLLTTFYPDIDMPFTRDQLNALFECAFEEVCVRYGDPYSSVLELFPPAHGLPQNLDLPDFDDID